VQTSCSWPDTPEKSLVAITNIVAVELGSLIIIIIIISRWLDRVGVVAFGVPVIIRFLF
jgi:hypothetical protein